MSHDERRTVDELLARYELEPTIRDVFVEGDSDRSTIQWFLDGSSKSDVVVYEISTVEISRDVVERFGVDSNNRGRVIALAYLIEANLGANSVQVTCIVDKDFDSILKTKYECQMLLLTDYACIEMYAFNAPTLEKFFRLYIRRTTKSVQDVLSELAVILQELFLIRLANKLLNLNLTAVNWEKCCVLTSNEVHFDHAEYIRRYLNANARLTELERFESVIRENREALTPDPRNQINGHDFIDLLTWYVYQRFGIKELNHSKVIERALFLCLEVRHLAAESLFQNLLARV